MKTYSTFTLIAIFFLSLFSCKSDKKAEPISRSMVTKGYEVVSAGEDLSKGALRFMEVEEYRNGILSKKTFFDGRENVKGIEKYEYDGKEVPQTSHYYAADGKEQAWYDLTYDDGKKVVAKGHEAGTDDLLRIERFDYDDEGKLVRKSIYDAASALQKSYNFSHDQYGNEVKMTVRDGNDKVILFEDYEIVEMDTLGRWLAKWGYVNGKGLPTTFQECSRSDFR